VLLVLYVVLITAGPDPDTSSEGLMIQVTGQKAIVYAIIVSVLIQSYGARKLIQEGAHPRPAKTATNLQQKRRTL
jgi:hypothetical protein